MTSTGPKGIDWESYAGLLGTVSDGEVAKELGVHRKTVREARVRLDIAARGHAGSFWNDPARQALLGTMHDTKLARQIGCTPASVARARQYRRIPAFGASPDPQGEPDTAPAIATSIPPRVPRALLDAAEDLLGALQHADHAPRTLLRAKLALDTALTPYRNGQDP